MSAIPYNLRPKATKLAAGPDATLDPPVSPTDALIRGVAVLDWPAADRSKGGTGPPDAPLARPATDPARRSVPASSWPRIFDRNRPVRETLSPLPDLDPDIAMWPVTPLQRWPFAGHPVVGIWPKGWAGIDSNAVMWVCTVGGEPGTWAQVGAGGSGWPTVNGAGPGNLTAQTVSGDTVGYNFTDEGHGGFNATVNGDGGLNLLDTGPDGLNLLDTGAGGITLDATAGPINVDVGGTGSSFNMTNTGTGGTDIVDSGGGGVQIHESGVSTGGITIDSSHHDVIVISSTQPISSTAGAPLGDTGWIDASGLLVNSWTANPIAQYRKLNGIVYLNLDLLNGNNVDIMTLPVGFRPAVQEKQFAVIISVSGTIECGSCIIMTTGVVQISQLASLSPPTAVGGLYVAFVAEA